MLLNNWMVFNWYNFILSGVQKQGMQIGSKSPI